MAGLNTSLPLHATNQVHDKNFDSVLIVANHFENDLKRHNLLEHFSDLTSLKELNKSFESEVTFSIVNKTRVVYSPTGPLNRDYDDVRSIADATVKAVEKAIKIGSKNPLIINAANNQFKHADQVSLLAALEAAHIPLEVREAKNSSILLKIDKLGFYSNNLEEANRLIKHVNAIELGRIVARDIGGSDPERMSAPNVANYVSELFLNSTNIKLEIVEGQENFEKDYPLFAAVNRAANVIPRHRGRIIKLEYSPTDGSPIDTTLFLVGKGITYDTGGADIKYGGHMAGMHRDKCGAAFVAGFFKTLALIKPPGIKVYGTLCMARNSIGEDAFVADELIKSRAKKIVRIGNTDAEGRMVMTDPLCEAKEKALNAINPFLFTIATLTGHVIRAYGTAYTGILSNGPARAKQVDYLLQQSGDVTGDPYEISTIRREDYKRVAGRNDYEDLLQCTNNPSSAEPRGHQFPAAFMIEASGLEKHGNDSDKQIPYTHVDIAGSSGDFPGLPTGSPLPSFFHHFILSRLA